MKRRLMRWKSSLNGRKKKNIKSYIEISKMLHTTPNEANRLLNLAVLPDDRIVKRMKEVMAQNRF